MVMFRRAGSPGSLGSLGLVTAAVLGVALGLSAAGFGSRSAVWAAPPADRLVLQRFTLESRPTPFGWANAAAVEAGDVDGDGYVELVLTSPEGRRLPEEERPEPFQVEVFRLAESAGPEPGWKAERRTRAGGFPLTLNGLVVADLYPQGPAEIWFTYLPAVGALEYDGQSYQPKDAWQTWANKPVPLARYGPRLTSGYRPREDGRPAGPVDPTGPDNPRGREKLLGFAYYYSPEVAVGLITISRPVKCPTKERDVQASAFFSPKDQLLILDLDGDGQDELLAAWSRHSRQFPARPFTLFQAATGRELFTLPGTPPDELAAGDVDGDGRPEVVLAGNELTAEGWPKQAVVRVLRWQQGALSESGRFTYPGGFITDLLVADADNDGQDDLLAALLGRVGDTDEVELSLVRAASTGW